MGLGRACVRVWVGHGSGFGMGQSLGRTCVSVQGTAWVSGWGRECVMDWLWHGLVVGVGHGSVFG